MTLVAEAKRLRRRSPKGHRRSLREIATELAKLSRLNANGSPFAAMSIKLMIERRLTIPVHQTTERTFHKLSVIRGVAYP